jgi:hypothetical protein
MLNPLSNWTTFIAKIFFLRNKRGSRRSLGQSLSRLTFQNLESRRVLTTTVTVSTLVDVVDATPSNLASISTLISNPGTDGKISLREAIQAANNDTDTDTNITFSSSLPVDGMGTRTITVTNGELEIEGRSSATFTLTIDSSGISPGVTIKGTQTNSNPNNGDGTRLFKSLTIRVGPTRRRSPWLG